MPVHTMDSPCCPLCGTPATGTLIQLQFSKKMHLPDHIQLQKCTACDFAFVTPADKAAYEAYYASARTDLIHDERDATQVNGWIRTQAPAFETLLAQPSPLHVLDFGCGGGNLLKMLATNHPQHQFVGFDMHSEQRRDDLSNVTFTHDLAPHKGACNLVILSHVLEHFADLNTLQSVIDLLTPDGILYIEVPNPARYTQSPQREFLFFIDRMHLTHFSAKSMLVLAERFGLDMQRYGILALPYRDGGTYPSHYFVFSKGTGSALDDIDSYITHEKARPSPLTEISRETPILIYGFGDNFFRATCAGGPLEKQPILAVMDQRHAELAQSEYAQHYTFMGIEDALKTHPEAPIVITLTWGASTIRDALRSKQTSLAPIFTI